MDEHPLVALFEVEPWAVIGFFAFAFLMFALGMASQGADPPKPKKAVIVDDDADIRRGLKSLIEARTPFGVVGEAADGATATHVIDSVHPDVVVVDVKLSGIDGIELTRRIKEFYPGTQVIGYSSPEDDATGTIMRRAGASAHLVKGDPPERIIETLLDFS